MARHQGNFIKFRQFQEVSASQRVWPKQTEDSNTTGTYVDK